MENKDGKTRLTYVSLFSGIEGFSVAASRVKDVEWEPVFFSEIDPFPCAVLEHHFPNVLNLGDICNIRVSKLHNYVTNDLNANLELDKTQNGRNADEWIRRHYVDIPRLGIDILAGGSPCQDVSVAGKRAGMQEGSGTRSSLAFEYTRLVDELHPRCLLWENVPGVLSSNNGRDFLAFLDSLVKRGYCLAYRVLDAQYTRVDSSPRGVPQRRKRVWVVGYFGGNELIPASVLFEHSGLCGHTPPRRESGKGFAAPVGYGPGRNDGMVEEIRGNGGECDGGRGGNFDGGNGRYGRVVDGAISLEGNGSRPSHFGTGYSESGASFTLNCIENHAVAYRERTNSNGEDVAATISASECKMGQQQKDVGGGYVIDRAVLPAALPESEEEPPLPDYIVRRLTPGECESLQFFPQGWTEIPWNVWKKANRAGLDYTEFLDSGKIGEMECPDSLRYKALGNSWATNCAEWILRRIVAAFKFGLFDF